MNLVLDLETSIHNKGNPYDTRNFIVTAHFKQAGGQVVCKFYDEPDFLPVVRGAVASATLFIGCNCKFDIAHLRNVGIELPVGCRVWDVMLAEFILSGQTAPFVSLDELATKYNVGKKDHTIEEYWEKGISTEDIPRDVVVERGNPDVTLTELVYRAQLSDPRMSPALHKLILLDGLDLLVLGDMEWNGFKYDVDASLARAGTLQGELEQTNAEILSHSPIAFNLDSGDLLSLFLFGGEHIEELRTPVQRVYKSGPQKGEAYVRNEFQGTTTTRFSGFFNPPKGSELKKEGFFSTAEDTLLQLKAKTKVQKRIVELLLRRATLSKLVGTYLEPLPQLIEDMHWKDNLIHGQFNQVVARTGRLSSSRPNMQNSPEEVDEFFITRFN
jgi:DNA polymerase I-like protein with 3'-5' exonuclease and polymerase domains